MRWVGATPQRRLARFGYGVDTPQRTAAEQARPTANRDRARLTPIRRSWTNHDEARRVATPTATQAQQPLCATTFAPATAPITVS